MKKNYLVSWSGGLDSTFLIYKLLNEGHHVDAIYTTLSNNKNKTEYEKNAIRNLLPYFNDRDFTYREDYYSVLLKGDNVLLFKQPLLWINALVYNLTNKTTNVALGYIMGDDIISYISDLHNLWNNTCKFLQHNIKQPELEFPLIKYPKEYIYEQLPKYLKENVVWCEHPVDNKPCGYCKPCKKMNDILENDLK